MINEEGFVKSTEGLKKFSTHQRTAAVKVGATDGVSAVFCRIDACPPPSLDAMETMLQAGRVVDEAWANAANWETLRLEVKIGAQKVIDGAGGGYAVLVHQQDELCCRDLRSSMCCCLIQCGSQAEVALVSDQRSFRVVRQQIFQCCFSVSRGCVVYDHQVAIRWQGGNLLPQSLNIRIERDGEDGKVARIDRVNRVFDHFCCNFETYASAGLIN